MNDQKADRVEEKLDSMLKKIELLETELQKLFSIFNTLFGEGAYKAFENDTSKKAMRLKNDLKKFEGTAELKFLLKIEPVVVIRRRTKRMKNSPKN